ncbi:hypothetical protein D9M72_391070 [compost metagenome]
MGAQALEADLNQPAGLLRRGKDGVELGQGRHGRLLHVDIGPGGDRRKGERRVRLDGGGQDDDVRGRTGAQQLFQIREDCHGVREPPGLRGSGVRYGHQFQGSGFLEPYEVGQVPLTEAVHAHQGDARAGGRICGVSSGAAAKIRGDGLLSHEVVLKG